MGNTGDPDESDQDFIINNVPQVFGKALYFDTGNDGPGDATGTSPDKIVVPFDKEINLLAPLALN